MCHRRKPHSYVIYKILYKMLLLLYNIIIVLILSSEDTNKYISFEFWVPAYINNYAIHIYTNNINFI